MKVPVIYSNKINLNGRLYTNDSISKIINLFENKKNEKFEIFGEIIDTNHNYLNIINMSNVSHKIDGLVYEDDILFASIKILDTHCGKLLKKYINNFVFRPRLLGNILDDNSVNVESLITFDAILKETDSFNTNEFKLILDNYNLKN